MIRGLIFQLVVNKMGPALSVVDKVAQASRVTNGAQDIRATHGANTNGAMIAKPKSLIRNRVMIELQVMPISTIVNPILALRACYHGLFPRYQKTLAEGWNCKWRLMDGSLRPFRQRPMPVRARPNNCCQDPDCESCVIRTAIYLLSPACPPTCRRCEFPCAIHSDVGMIRLLIEARFDLTRYKLMQAHELLFSIPAGRIHGTRYSPGQLREGIPSGRITTIRHNRQVLTALLTLAYLSDKEFASIWNLMSVADYADKTLMSWLADRCQEFYPLPCWRTLVDTSFVANGFQSITRGILDAIECAASTVDYAFSLVEEATSILLHPKPPTTALLLHRDNDNESVFYSSVTALGYPKPSPVVQTGFLVDDLSSQSKEEVASQLQTQKYPAWVFTCGGLLRDNCLGRFFVTTFFKTMPLRTDEGEEIVRECDLDHIWQLLDPNKPTMYAYNTPLQLLTSRFNNARRQRLVDLVTCYVTAGQYGVRDLIVDYSDAYGDWCRPDSYFLSN